MTTFAGSSVRTNLIHIYSCLNSLKIRPWLSHETKVNVYNRTVLWHDRFWPTAGADFFTVEWRLLIKVLYSPCSDWGENWVRVGTAKHLWIDWIDRGAILSNCCIVYEPAAYPSNYSALFFTIFFFLYYLSPNLLISLFFFWVPNSRPVLCPFRTWRIFTCTLTLVNDFYISTKNILVYYKRLLSYN